MPVSATPAKSPINSGAKAIIDGTVESMFKICSKQIQAKDELIMVLKDQIKTLENNIAVADYRLDVITQRIKYMTEPRTRSREERRAQRGCCGRLEVAPSHVVLAVGHGFEA